MKGRMNGPVDQNEWTRDPARRVKVHDGGEHLGLEHPPLVVVVFRHGDEVRAEKHGGDAVDVEKFLRQRARRG